MFQSILATVAVWIALEALRLQNLLIAASLAATAFTVFTMPSSVIASSRNVIGGHMIGLTFGLALALVPHNAGASQGIVYALAVGSSMFVMTVTNTEHPPAAGTALGVVIAGCTLRVVLGVVIGIGILSILHRVLKPLLRDLVAKDN
ncbi:MAG: HPP family protein [Verrucomicrobiota bacterium]